jgi:hypothetical protein
MDTRVHTVPGTVARVVLELSVMMSSHDGFLWLARFRLDCTCMSLSVY